MFGTLILLGVFNQVIAKCGEGNVALYELKFEAKWTRERFPKVYPVTRPHAEWSPVLGQTHNSNFNLFTNGEYITRELQPFVERGDSSLLTAFGQETSIVDFFSTTNLETGSGIVTTRFFADSDRHFISAVVKIIPSPDWFVGLNSLELCATGGWVASVTKDLYPLDAGTQRGYTFSSPRWRSDPQEKIFRITHEYPNHTADAFYYPQFDELPPIASFTIKLVDVFTKSKYEAPPMPIHMKPTDYHLHHTKAPHHTYRRPHVRPPVFDPAALQPEAVEPQTTPQLTSMEREDTLPKTTNNAMTSSSGVIISDITEPPNNVSRTSTASTPPLDVIVFNTTEREEETTGIFIDRGADQSQLTSSDELEEIGSGGVDDETYERDFAEEVQEEIDPLLPPSATNRILPPDGSSYEGIQRRCLVSEWSEWTTCSKTCGYGMKMRTREIVHTTGNVACPELIVEQLCGSMKLCNWNHFSLTFNSTSSVVKPGKGRRRPLKDRMEQTGEGQVRGMLRGRSRFHIMREQREGK